jgi:dihydrofolate reductase
MSKVTSDISMSLDGFVTDPEASFGTPLEGNDPGRLHDWQFDAKTEADAKIVDERYASTGTVLIGRRMFDAGFEPWGRPSAVRYARIRADPRGARASAHAGRYDIQLRDRDRDCP